MDLYLLIDGQVYGPYAEEDVWNKISTGEVSMEVLSCFEGREEWVPVGQLYAGQETGVPCEQKKVKLNTGGDIPFGAAPRNADTMGRVSTKGKTCPFCGTAKTKRAPNGTKIQFLSDRYCTNCGGAWKRQISEGLAQVEFMVISLLALVMIGVMVFVVFGTIILPAEAESIKESEESGRPYRESLAPKRPSLPVAPLFLFTGSLLISSLVAAFFSFKRLIKKHDRLGEIIVYPSQESQNTRLGN